MSPMPGAPARSRYSIEALSRGLETLALFNADRPSLSLTEIVSNLPGSKSTAFRVLSTLDVQTLCARYPIAGESASPCYADGGCISPDLKCLAQPVTNGLSTNLCTRGCALGANATCDVPFSCQASTSFSGFSGACLLPGSIVTAVGRDCVGNPDCGNSFGYCQAPTAISGGHFAWVEGYCTQACDPRQPPCPPGATTRQLRWS